MGASKSSKGWRATVGRMVATMDDPDFLTEQEKNRYCNFFKSAGEKK